MQWKVEVVSTDVLVLGGGMAGFRAALAAQAQGADVTLAYRARGASPYVIGFNAPIGSVDPMDSPDVFYEDMLKGGYFLNDRRLVRLLAEKSVDAFHELVAWGVPFAHAADSADGGGQVLQRHLSGNRYPRSVFVPESTGGAILQVMANRARSLGIHQIAGQKAVELLRDGADVVGAVLWKPHSDQITVVHARAVVIAMGGIGRLYADSTYPVDVGADGLGMALDAGARLIDMEFVQFEPVVTVWPQECRGMEMPTSMLGDGAHLLNNRGERFMLGYNPPLGERGIEKARLALFIQREIDEGRGFPEGGVAFDATVLSEQQRESYVSHCRRLRAAGVDPATTPPIVAPAAHSMMGGVAVDGDCWSGVPGLYVGGEAAGGVHGASRIAGNGCSDTLVFGAIAGGGAARGMLPATARDWPAIEASAIARLAHADGGACAEDVRQAKEDMRKVLSEAAGIWRNGPGLTAGLAAFGALHENIFRMRAGSREAAVELREARRMAAVGTTVLQAALGRTESRGAHQRTDFPATDNTRWLQHIAFTRGGSDELVQSLEPIH
ncbi:FAD-binding protein [Cupriavidus basilensis]|uniref:FAD-binding protein n=1 Tax=Cupriavidus basilensis TaxID=68895 RepID=UPI000750784A|nr:FAD-binding protein [Cupriavidus basilensis]